MLVGTSDPQGKRVIWSV